MAEAYQPLVSVYVVTYNSSATVIETLDSIYNQTYPNIELIVSDDCSPDNTVEICREWIATHKDRFVRTVLLTVEKNTGVSGNCNRAEAACHGEWSKGIAGDDILLPNCIQDCVDYVSKHPDTVYLFGEMEPFGGTEQQRQSIIVDAKNPIKNATPQEQLSYLLMDHCFIQAPCNFVNIPKSKAFGVKNDERIPMMEDWPKWINILRTGGRFNFMNKIIVRYRLSDLSLSTSSTPSLKFQKSQALFFIYYQFKPFWQSGYRKYAIKRYIQAKRVVENNLFWKCTNFMAKKML